MRDAHPEVTLTVRLEDDPDSESPKLSVSIDATIKNVISQEEAENIYKWLMNFVHIQKATQGNINVDLNVNVVD